MVKSNLTYLTTKRYWFSHATGSMIRAVTNFSSRRGIEKSSRGTKKSGAAAELAGGVGGYRGGLGFQKITFANIGVTEKS